jgi:hypothetical protein
MPIDYSLGTDLAALHQSIVDTSAAAFSGVHFEFYRDERVSLPFGDGVGNNPPRAYCLFDLTEMEPADMDPATEQMAVMAKFTAAIIIKSLQPDACLLVRVLAGQYAAFLRKQLRWPSVLNGGILLSGCYKDDFSPELDQFEVWRIDWSQEIWLGNVYEAPPPMPTTPLFSYVPIVGVPYKSEYQEALIG